MDIHFSIPTIVEKKLIEEGKQIPNPIPCTALIDTGASNCVVQEDIPTKLELNPIDEIFVNTPSCDSYRCYRYFLKLTILPQNLVYEGVFTAVPLKGQNIQSLLGRNLLSNCVLAYIGYINQFTLSL